MGIMTPAPPATANPLLDAITAECPELLRLYNRRELALLLGAWLKRIEIAGRLQAGWIAPGD